MESGARPLVLIVDDDEDTCEVYSLYLRCRGYRVESASDGRAGVSKAISLLPAVVVMDGAMPGMTGLEATQLLKADPRTRHIHVIAVTGNAKESARRDALAAGASAYLCKPCLPDTLAEAIAAQLCRTGGSSCPSR